ncbi:polymorphic toxin-type HINT domain-containing protein [Streptomyces goshikiensis]|uniref:RHS repeat-associated core domain-containing protein n=1 Tax=Streptomyces goshikiensis TaxID=1942 RepID=UPI0022F3C36B|nr:RHS repeat-associated core domain-containing protein [Streptomyces goshikiensis]WBY20179.1 polymorphic toxin-type HINT domain-containing protein [Streptomyces goshikiensis]
MSLRGRLLNRRISRRTLGSVVIGLSLALSASSVHAVEPAPGGTKRPGVQNFGDPVKGTKAKSKGRPANATAKAAVKKLDKPVWPGTGSAELAVPTAGGAPAAQVKVGGLPVTVTTPKDTAGKAPAASFKPAAVFGSKQPGKVQVDVVAPERAAKLGAGALLRVQRADQAADGTQVRVNVDYSAFADGFGGSYGSRLRLVELPACAAVADPGTPACPELPKPLKTVNNPKTKTVSADVTAPARTAGMSVMAAGPSAGGSMIALAAGDSSSQGNYAATPLAPSAKWSVANSSGGFSWSYPLRTPPTPGGLVPTVGLGYSSQSADGRTSDTNNQGSWLGEGFSYEPGYIERHYKPCAKDGQSASAEQCWAFDNATVMLNGSSTELVKDDTDGKWHMGADDGSKIEQVTGAVNGDNDGEHWKITTTDGTEYWFGRNRLPGWATGNEETASVWTSPVFGNNAGEPCYNATFANASCQQAWRWNLDYVKDRQGNVMSYFYGKETNSYALNGKTDVNGTAYTAGGYLKRADYGQREATVYSAKAPARVVFTTQERCLPTDTFKCLPADFKKENAAYWPDVPMDRYCAANTKCTATQVAASFWTRQRLTGVTTQIRKDATTYEDVEAWTFTHQFTDNGDQSKTLWLSKIDHEGLRGGSAKVPSVELMGTQLANRVDGLNESIAPFHRFRLSTVLSETGAQLDVNYAPAECTKDALPKPGESTKRCYPVVWSPPGFLDPITDWFHKYVVARVIETDRTGGAPEQVTNYEYQGPAAWRKAEPDGLTEDKYLTWGGWQGYGKVKVTTGGTATTKTRIDYTYLQGMDGDKDSAGGTRSVQVADSEGGTYTDHKEFSGHELESATYDGDKLVSKVIKTPMRHYTATDTNTWGTSHASFTKTVKTRGYTVTEGGDGRREAESNATYDLTNGTGRILESEDLGDLSTAADDTCTRTSYADNAAANIRSTPSRVESVSVKCATTPDRKTQVISDERTSYDGLAFGAAPTVGNATKTERMTSHNGTTATYQVTGTTTYDAFGRPASQIDALGAETKTAYTDVNGLISQVKVTNALGHVNTRDFDPAWGLSTGQTDPNGKRGDLAFDPLGRLVSVWLPDRSKSAAQTPSVKYSYNYRLDKPVSVKTEKIEIDGSYGAEYDLYDSLLRPRQKQTEGPSGTRMVADTFYTPTGKIAKVNSTYNAAGAASDELLIVRNGDVGAQTLYEYDGLGRTTAQIAAVAGGEQWQTTIVHGGDRTHVDPPVGGTPTTTLTDSQGRTTEVRHYKGASPVPDGSTSGYDTTKYAYTPTGKLKQLTDPANNVWTYKYDQLDRLIEAVDPDSGKRTTSYDEADRPTSVTDARGKTVSTVYDKLDRVLTTWDGPANTGTKRTEQRYDKAGWLGYQWASLRYVNATEYFASVTQAMDEFYQPLKTAYTVPASSGTGLAGTYVFSAAYNRDGTKQSDSLPAAGGLDAETLAYTYDEIQRLKTMTGATPYVTDATWSSRTLLQQLELNNGGKKVWQTFQYETGTDRLMQSKVDVYGSTTGPAKQSNYSYDQIGNVKSIADVAGAGAPDLQCFAYDYQARMTESWTPSTTKAAAAASGTVGSQVPVSGSGPAACNTAPGSSALGGPAPYWNSYTFDSVGNRLTETVHDTGLNATKDVKRTFTYKAGTHQAQKVVENTPTGDRQYTYGYDAAGNTTTRTIGGNTQTLEYDALGDPVKNSQPDDVTTPGKNEASETTFLYGPDGGRVQRKDATGTTVYLPGMELRLDAGTTTPKATRYYAFAGQSIAIRTPDKKLSFLASDHHGTADMSIDATTGAVTQRRMDPYGNSRGTPQGTWKGEKGFVGGTIDASTGLTTIGAREYDSFLGKFITPDPVVDTSDAQQLNAYAYAHNRPVSASDPTGLYDPDEREFCRGNDQCTNGKYTPKRDKDPDPEIEEAQNNLTNAEGEHNRTKAKIKNAVKQITKILMDELGVTAALDCFSSGDLGACGETALNIASSFAGGIAGKVLKKYGWPTQWEKAASLIKKLGGLAVDLVSGVKAWFKTSAKVEKAKGALAAVKARFKKGDCHSFLPGTAVVLADGGRKNIEDVKLGDEVVTTDPSTGETVTREVVGTVVTEDDKEFVDLTVSGNAGSSSLVATVTHPFWVENEQRFVEAGALKPGMVLRTPEGEKVPVEGLRFFERRQKTHDLGVDGIHAFYVVAGSTPLLAHNCPTGLGSGPEPEPYEVPIGDDGNPVGGHSSGTARPGWTGETPNSVYTRTGQDGTPVQNTIYDANGDAVGHYDFKHHNTGGEHGHVINPPGTPGGGHGAGAPHIRPENLPPGWGRRP